METIDETEEKEGSAAPESSSEAPAEPDSSSRAPVAVDGIIRTPMTLCEFCEEMYKWKGWDTYKSICFWTGYRWEFPHFCVDFGEDTDGNDESEAKTLIPNMILGREPCFEGVAPQYEID